MQHLQYYLEFRDGSFTVKVWGKDLKIIADIFK